MTAPSHIVYRGNVVIEELDTETVVRSGGRQYHLPTTAVGAAHLRDAALRLRDPLLLNDFPVAGSDLVLDRIGALSRTTLLGHTLPGWRYVLRHYLEVDEVMHRMQRWTVHLRHTPAALADLATQTLQQQVAMFIESTPGSETMRCDVLILDGSASDGAALAAASRRPAELSMIISLAGDEATVLITPDIDGYRRRRALLGTFNRLSATSRPASQAALQTRLLLSLGVVLLVDEVSGSPRLRNSYHLGADMSVVNVQISGLPRSLNSLNEVAFDGETSDARYVSDFITATFEDLTVPIKVSVDVVNGIPLCRCEAVLRGPLKVTRTGANLAEAGTAAIAEFVRQVLQRLGTPAVVAMGSDAAQDLATVGPSNLLDLDPWLAGRGIIARRTTRSEGAPPWQ